MRYGSMLAIAGTMAAASVSAEELRVVTWPELRAAGRLTHGEVLDRDGPHQFVLKLSSPAGAAWTVAEIDDPGVTAIEYQVTGQVRCEDVSQPGYLEMWSLFPDGGRYFSRTLAGFGPMGTLKGTADWRDFTLPFSTVGAPAGTRPNKLVVNVVLPGGGTVYLSRLRLAQAENSAWWSDQTGGWVGGVIGTVFGLIGAAVGVLASFPRTRYVVLGLLGTCVAFGIVFLGIGLTALLLRQPYAVWYPMLLAGIILGVVAGGLIPVVRRRFETLELQRMQALDSA